MDAEVVGVLVAVNDRDEPVVLAPGTPPRLPSGPLLADEPSLQRSTRSWVERLTGHRPGYLEQLYTFADAGRPGVGSGERTISVSYLGLSRATPTERGWACWYDLLPWEDMRADNPHRSVLVGQLLDWAGEAPDERMARVSISFGVGGPPWQPELVLQRYELLYEAGLIPESPESGRHPGTAPGPAMYGDHRRIVATGLARLRAKIQYRPVVFELMPPEFTLSELQRCVEAIAGQAVHTQNFRRTVAQQELVEETGRSAHGTGGRPAKVVRFRRSVLLERQVAGTKFPVIRTH